MVSGKNNRYGDVRASAPGFLENDCADDLLASSRQNTGEFKHQKKNSSEALLNGDFDFKAKREKLMSFGDNNEDKLSLAFEESSPIPSDDNNKCKF